MFQRCYQIIQRTPCLHSNELLIQGDYVEGYENTEQNEIQSVYFGHETFSLRGEDGELINENISIVSEDNDHSRINTNTCTKKVINLFLLYQVNNM